MTLPLVVTAGLIALGAGSLQARAQQPDAHHLATGRWVRVIATNDFHGALEPRRDGTGTLRGGAATLAAEIARARAECRATCTSVLLDGGDQFQGTPVSNLSFGRPVVELFNHLGQTASALGNHELDWGQDTLRARMRDARYRILGANVVGPDGRDVDWIPDDTLVVAGPVRVGIIGVATVGTARMSQPANVAGLRFIDPAPVVDARARALRARGADLLIVVAHAGGFCNDTSPSCSGEIIDFATAVTERVDAIVSGHTHSAVNTTVRGIPIVQARSSGTALGLIDISLDPGVAPVISLRDILPDRIAADPVVDSMVRARIAPIQSLVQRPIAEIAERMPNAIAGNLIADAQRAAGGGDVAVMNRGGVRASIGAGTATYGSLFEVAPFANTLVRITLRGAALRGYLERLVARREPGAHLSGAVVTFDTTRAVGARIVSVVLSDGRPLDDRVSYRLVMSDFMANGGDGLQVNEGADRVEDLGIVDLDALIAWLRSQPSPVRAPTDARFVVRPPRPS